MSKYNKTVKSEAPSAYTHEVEEAFNFDDGEDSDFDGKHLFCNSLLSILIPMGQAGLEIFMLELPLLENIPFKHPIMYLVNYISNLYK